MEQISNSEWKLKNLEINLQGYGEFEGKYVGRITFENKQREAFTFNVRPEMAEEYLRLIKNELVGAASHLGERLLESLNLLPPAPEKKQIGEAIEHEPVTA